MRKKKASESEDESLEFLQGIATGVYSFTEITHHKPEKPSPRIAGFVRPKPVRKRRTTTRKK